MSIPAYHAGDTASIRRNGVKGEVNPMLATRELPPSIPHHHIFNVFLVPPNPVPLPSPWGVQSIVLLGHSHLRSYTTLSSMLSSTPFNPWGVQSVICEKGRMSSYDISRLALLLGVVAQEHINFVATRVLTTKPSLVLDIRVNVPNKLYDRYFQH